MLQSQIETLIQEIENETIPSANTATRVSNVLRQLKNKVRPYKSYTALMSQSANNPISLIPLENEIPFSTPLSFYLDDIGTFICQLDMSLADFNKLIVFPINSNQGQEIRIKKLNLGPSMFFIKIETLSELAYSNDVLLNDFLEIRLYE